MSIYDATTTLNFTNIYWIGGSPCSGKSSVADLLAEKYGFALYRCDEAFYEHRKIVTAELQPVFHRLVHLSSEDLWMRPVAQQVAEEIACYHEEFPLILEDLLAYPRTQPVLVEGAALLPECVYPLLSHPRRAIWIVPTGEFQMHHYQQRAWAKDVVKACSDPEQAFLNWMQRDIAFAHHVAHEAARQALPLLVVGEQRSLVENIAWSEQYLGLSL
jgi:2-phosphoglycerate kinase